MNNFYTPPTHSSHSYSSQNTNNSQNLLTPEQKQTLLNSIQVNEVSYSDLAKQSLESFVPQIVLEAAGVVTTIASGANVVLTLAAVGRLAWTGIRFASTYLTANNKKAEFISKETEVAVTKANKHLALVINNTPIAFGHELEAKVYQIQQVVTALQELKTNLDANKIKEIAELQKGSTTSSKSVLALRNSRQDLENSIQAHETTLKQLQKELLALNELKELQHKAENALKLQMQQEILESQKNLIESTEKLHSTNTALSKVTSEQTATVNQNTKVINQNIESINNLTDSNKQHLQQMQTNTKSIKELNTANQNLSDSQKDLSQTQKVSALFNSKLIEVQAQAMTELNNVINKQNIQTETIFKSIDNAFDLVKWGFSKIWWIIVALFIAIFIFVFRQFTWFFENIVAIITNLSKLTVTIASSKISLVVICMIIIVVSLIVLYNKSQTKKKLKTQEQITSINAS